MCIEVGGEECRSSIYLFSGMQPFSGENFVDVDYIFLNFPLKRAVMGNAISLKPSL